MSLPAGELGRKAVHIGMGLLALSLRWLAWDTAALIAAFAVAANAFVVPRALPGILRGREVEKRFSVGIVLYPAVVLSLIVLFRERLQIAAAAWGLLAFGDGFATLAGMRLSGPRLLWNPRKSWSGLGAYVLFGAVAAAALYGFVAVRLPSAGELLALAAAAVAGAAVESLPSELDDNVAAPLVGAAVLGALLPGLSGWTVLGTPGWLHRAALAAGVNLAMAVSALALRLVRPSGALAGGISGAVVWAFGGPAAYVLLWIFFAFGTLATRFRRRRKEAMGKAEEAEGRRGAAHVLANVSVPAFCSAAAAFQSGRAGVGLCMATAAAFATALMDTIGTEVGQAVTSPTVLLPDFRRVPPGTDGAVSVAGTLAGLLGAGAVAEGAVLTGWIPSWGVVPVLLAAALGTTVESLLGRAGASWRVRSGHVLNFYNTLAGAAAGWALALFGGRGA